MLNVFNLRACEGEYPLFIDGGEGRVLCPAVDGLSAHTEPFRHLANAHALLWRIVANEGGMNHFTKGRGVKICGEPEALLAHRLGEEHAGNCVNIEQDISFAQIIAFRVACENSEFFCQGRCQGVFSCDGLWRVETKGGCEFVETRKHEMKCIINHLLMGWDDGHGGRWIGGHRSQSPPLSLLSRPLACLLTRQVTYVSSLFQRISASRSFSAWSMGRENQSPALLKGESRYPVASGIYPSGQRWASLVHLVLQQAITST